MAAKKKTEATPPAEGSALSVVGVQIRNVLGATAYQMTPGKITVLEGPNGSGKSTALQAVQAGIGRGNLAKLARVGSEGEDVEVVLVIEGPDEHYRVERGADKLRVRKRVGNTAGFEDVPRPQEFLSALFDPDGANPARFLLAPDKERALLLLEALPIKMDRAELLAAMGLTDAELRQMAAIPTGLHPLEEIELIRDAVFRTRTGVNRDGKGKAEAAEQTRRNAPAALPDNPADEILRAQQQATKLAEDLAAGNAQAHADEEAATTAARSAYKLASAKLSADLDATVARLRADHEAKAAEIRAAAERRVAELKAQAETALDDARSKADDELSKAAETMNAGLVKAREDREVADTASDVVLARLDDARQKLAILREQAEGATKARALYDQAKQFDEEATRLEAEGERLTDAIKALDSYRRKLGESIPIDGLAINDKLITVHGVDFNQLNTAQRVAIAVKVAALRSEGHRLKVVFVDGAEALDAPHFEALVAELKGSGLQAFIARVEDTDGLRDRVVA